jgi:hypothetical protein
VLYSLLVATLYGTASSHFTSFARSALFRCRDIKKEMDNRSAGDVLGLLEHYTWTRRLSIEM